MRSKKSSEGPLFIPATKGSAIPFGIIYAIQRDISTASSVLLMWLNGWLSAEKFATAFTQNDLGEYLRISCEGQAQGRRQLAWEHTAESQGRIVDLLRVLKDEISFFESNKHKNPDVWSIWCFGITERMRKYVSFPTLLCLDGRIFVEHEFDGYQFEIGRRPEEPAPLFPLGEALAAHALLQIAAAGSIGDIRECKQCENWLFAKRDHGSFCDDQCRTKWNQNQPENKAIKAAKANCAYHHKKASEAAKAGDTARATAHRSKESEARAESDALLLQRDKYKRTEEAAR